ncbi:MAG: V-type ATPase subunit [Armatimonadota bacterium]|nr:V-type ATPase subunit [Armatimonadota bacterium]MDR7439904.1 V-type ATPase subunit [Armatimonadota bacterium]MDR7562525.1 V-type ATPase subunit [Armatimonadota bacterium]MDR7568220.1 V-type ATPase subunit [Armatimonadota bacterium]MDR7601409.1 V-type ATPase subunit [Armatimonadota bacterium]
MPEDFGYINARVKGMRSRLLPPGRLEELLGLADLESFIHALGNTPYGPELQEALTRYQGLRAVDEALMRAFQKTAQKILGFSEGKARALIRVFLVQWDLHNLRTILRAKHSGHPLEATEQNLIPAGELTEVRLRELLAQPDLAALAGTLATWEHPLAEALLAAIRQYESTQDLLSLELSLDRGYFEWALRVARGMGHNETLVRDVVRMQIDFTNVKTAFKLQQLADLSREERERFFLPGGSVVSRDVFLNLADPTTAEFGLRELRGRGIHPEGQTAGEVERFLEEESTRRMAMLYLGDPLGIDVVIGFLTMLSSEIRNLRLIARSKALGIPRDLVRREMALV